MSFLYLFVVSYHIAGTGGVYYSREPYSNVDAVHVTRFIGLASVGNREKQVCYFSFVYLCSESITPCLIFSYGKSDFIFLDIRILILLTLVKSTVWKFLILHE